jgi:hypothetical protein
LLHRPLVLVALIGTLSTVAVSAQRASPAAVVRSRSTHPEVARLTADSNHSLQYHMKRGTTYGTITGAALSGLVVIAISNRSGSCCEQSPTHVTFRQSVAILAGGSAAGAVIGAMLGYSYHLNNQAK